MDNKVKARRLELLDAMHQQRKRKQQQHLADKKHSSKKKRNNNNNRNQNTYRGDLSRKDGGKRGGRPTVANARQTSERERENALGGEVVSKQVLESLGVKQKEEENNESRVQDVLDELLQSNPKHHYAVRSSLLKEVWRGKLADKTLSFENPAATVSLAQAQKKALKHKLSNCLAVREKTREKKRFLKNTLQSKRDKNSDTKEKEKEEVKNLSWKYHDFSPLHEQWLEYATKWYHQNRTDIKDALSKMELCGASIKVLSSIVPNYCNLEGYVVDVMSHSFRIVSKEDRLQTVPLKGCLFQVVAKQFSFVIQGDQALERKVFHQL